MAAREEEWLQPVYQGAALSLCQCLAEYTITSSLCARLLARSQGAAADVQELPCCRTDRCFALLQMENLCNFLPTFLALAEYDPLLYEGIMYGDQLKAAGVPARIKIFRDDARFCPSRKYCQ